MERQLTFIGVGAIGLPMALQIQKAGHSVTGVDVFEPVIARAKASGLHAVNGFAAAPAAEVVVVMVATPEQLAQVVAEVGDKAHGQLWILMSTVGPLSVREQGQALQRVGARGWTRPLPAGSPERRLGSWSFSQRGNHAISTQPHPYYRRWASFVQRVNGLATVRASSSSTNISARCISLRPLRH